VVLDDAVRQVSGWNCAVEETLGTVTGESVDAVRSEIVWSDEDNRGGDCRTRGGGSDECAVAVEAFVKEKDVRVRAAAVREGLVEVVGAAGPAESAGPINDGFDAQLEERVLVGGRDGESGCVIAQPTLAGG